MIKRTTELYKLVFEKTSNKELIRIDELVDYNIIEDFLKDFYTAHMQKNLKERRIELPDKKMCIWIDSMTEEDSIYGENFVTRKVCMHYLKHSKSLKVKDRHTLEDRYKKNKDDGDDEKQHYVIRTLPDKNTAVLVWEKILGAIIVKDIGKLFKTFYKQWIKDKFEDDKDKFDILKKFHPEIYAIPSAKFLEELENIDNINLLDATIKATKIPGIDFDFSNEGELRDEINLVRKSKRGHFYRKKDIISCYKKYNKNNNIKRMVIKGKRNGASIRLDTQGMRFTEKIDLVENSDGLIDTDFLFEEYEKTLDNFFKFIYNQNINIELAEND